jgi:hypothetical protein
MEEASENSKESSHSAHANEMNEWNKNFNKENLTIRDDFDNVGEGGKDNI